MSSLYLCLVSVLFYSFTSCNLEVYLKSLWNIPWENITIHLSLFAPTTTIVASFLTVLLDRNNNSFTIQIHPISCWQYILYVAWSPKPPPGLMIAQEDSLAIAYVSTQWLWLIMVKRHKAQSTKEKVQGPKSWGSQPQASRVLSQWGHTGHT